MTWVSARYGPAHNALLLSRYESPRVCGYTGDPQFKVLSELTVDSSATFEHLNTGLIRFWIGQGRTRYTIDWRVSLKANGTQRQKFSCGSDMLGVVHVLF